MIVPVILMLGMAMAIVNIVNVITVRYSDMPAIWAILMIMIGMNAASNVFSLVLLGKSKGLPSLLFYFFQ